MGLKDRISEFCKILLGEQDISTNFDDFKIRVLTQSYEMIEFLRPDRNLVVQLGTTKLPLYFLLDSWEHICYQYTITLSEIADSLGFSVVDEKGRYAIDLEISLTDMIDLFKEFLPVMLKLYQISPYLIRSIQQYSWFVGNDNNRAYQIVTPNRIVSYDLMWITDNDFCLFDDIKQQVFMFDIDLTKFDPIIKTLHQERYLE